ncbi:unnamed protein product [Urochloa humidicola]
MSGRSGSRSIATGIDLIVLDSSTPPVAGSSPSFPFTQSRISRPRRFSLFCRSRPRERQLRRLLGAWGVPRPRRQALHHPGGSPRQRVAPADRSTSSGESHCIWISSPSPPSFLKRRASASSWGSPSLGGALCL